MKRGIKVFLLTIGMLGATSAHAQVLISLIFGEALNTPKIEFGLVGGINYSYILSIDEAKPISDFNLGFYFHILLKKNSYISTGVLVKSTVGAQGMPTYPRNNQDFDTIFADGDLTKDINYFYVPIMYHHRFNNNRWYAEGGFQLGLRHKAYDVFNTEAVDGELDYKLDTRDQYARFDGGLMAGFAYKFKPIQKSLSLGVNYYYGLKNVSLTDQVIKNSSIYIYLKIPIGIGKEPESN